MSARTSPASQARSTAPLSQQRPKVVYIMGAGHSGSTILGVALGNCEGVFYAGEIEEWLANSGAPYLGGSERVRFWRAVSAEMNGVEELFGTQVNRNVERSSALLRVGRWRVRRRLRTRYREVAEDLLYAIARNAGATHVVDSSHFPLRAKELQALGGIDLYLVLLLRNPQRVVASGLRGVSPHDVAERRLRTVSLNLGLWLTSMLSTVVFLRHPRERRLLVSHEDFLARPGEVLRRILDTAESAAAEPDLSSLQTGVPLIGNKLLRAEVVALNTRAEAPAKGSVLTAVLQLPWSIMLSHLRPAVVVDRRAAAR